MEIPHKSIPLRPFSPGFRPINPTDAIPPHSLENEEAAIGAIMYDSRVAKIAFEMLSREDFYHETNAEIFDTLRSMEDAIDEIIVSNAHKNRGFLVDNDFKDKLARMIQKTSPGCIEGYCEELQKLTRARKLQKAAIQALQSIETDADAGTAAALSAVSDIVPRDNSKSPMEVLTEQIEAEIDGTRTILGIPYLNTLSKTQFFLPGSITVICGGAGASKSLFTGEMTWRMSEFGIKPAKLNLESGAEFHIRRTLAQMAGDARITEVSFAVNFPDDIRSVVSQFHKELHKIVLDRTMQVPQTSKLMNCTALLRWISQEADNGKEVLIIDPITMMDSEDRGHLAEIKFIQTVRGIVDRKQIRLVLVTHPKKTGGSADSNVIHLDNLSGSTAFQRFVDSVFWLEAHAMIRGNFKADFDQVKIYTEDYNRTIHILKARLGPGTGKKVAYFLSPDTLRHVERGFIE